MKTSELLERLETIKQKDKTGEVYNQLINLAVDEVITLINTVDEMLIDEEIQNLIDKMTIINIL